MGALRFLRLHRWSTQDRAGTKATNVARRLDSIASPVDQRGPNRIGADDYSIRDTAGTWPMRRSAAMIALGVRVN
jgi:hypothetical protein